MLAPVTTTDPFVGLPCGHYAAIAADPGWKFGARSARGETARSPQKKYTTLALPEIKALPVGSLASRDCHLFLWITGPLLAAGVHRDVLQAWGFKPSSIWGVWLKANRKAFEQGGFFLDESLFWKGMGFTTRQNAEYVVLGRRGSPQRQSKSVHQLIIAPRREHSRKPDEFFQRVEQYAAGPYIELFSRQERPGWDAWGDEVGKFCP